MIAEQVRDYLGTKGFTNLRFGMKQEQPDNAIFVRDVSAPVLAESQGHDIDSGGVQITVRNTNSLTARTQCVDIYKELVSFRMDRFKSSGNAVVMTNCQTVPSYIGPDDKGRHEYTTTFTIRFDR